MPCCRHSYVTGIIDITETHVSSSEVPEQEDAGRIAQQQLADYHQACQHLIANLLLTCGTYGSPSTTAATTATHSTEQDQLVGGDASAATLESTSTIAALSAFAADIEAQSLQLFGPWSDAACAEQCQQLLQQMTEQVHVLARPDLEATSSQTMSSATAQLGGASEPTRTQPPGSTDNTEQLHMQQTRLLLAALPLLLPSLRQVLYAEAAHRRAQEKGETGMGCTLTLYSAVSVECHSVVALAVIGTSLIAVWCHMFSRCGSMHELQLKPMCGCSLML